jgi:hypothetical protein
MIMKRINIIGTSGSGKSTFAKNLAEALSVPYVEMDALFWGPDWAMPDDEELLSRLASALDGDGWVLDGNYTRTLPTKWKTADTVIWLDFSFIRTLLQAATRAIARVASQEELWPGTGNRETLGRLFSRDSILLWTIRTHGPNRKKFTTYMESPDFSHMEFLRLRSPREARRFLQSVHDNRGCNPESSSPST